MARNPDATRARILDAAEAEFATYGIAGARVDRIAETAPANKALIYKYFGNKEELFDTVFAQRALAFVDEVEFDAADLPGYAGRSFDLYERYPRTLRLTTWYQLERAEGTIPAIVESNANKLRKIAEAQAAGQLTTAYSPLELLTEVRALAMSWHLHTPELAVVPRPSRERCREIVVESVRRLVA
ncbi:TetR family transcriptional regulator [Sinomonas sp. JGH33]|uniref:TetR family transcriptional regulator n=1 Tax=Sinomonas terricola TaxID=3110330 RepID=A0ABU5T584_9MICC|nr:TetR family transcriptional regulator [Sinomonas sp. JGH33]MEA5454832.1 TetR family transcriptional regulator [Sinomonas sp. JGH33]